MLRPFNYSRIERDADQIAHYLGRPESLIAMLRATVDRYPRNEAIVELGGERIDYQELWDRSARVAGGLKDSGVQRGDRVAIRLGNSLDWCVAFWGTLMAGAVVVPVNTRFSEPEIEYVVNDSGSRFVFHPGHPLPTGHPLVVEDLTKPDLAAIFYTSGTTGFPKGAMTTQEGFLWQEGASLTSFAVTGAVATWTSGVNSSGYVTGGYQDSNFVTHGYIRGPSGTIFTFSAPDAAQGTYPVSINDKGDVAGYYLDANYVAHGFVVELKS